jgi:hypothetical protein
MPGCVAGLGHVGLKSGSGKKDNCSNPDDAWRRSGFFILHPHLGGELFLPAATQGDH